MYRAFYQTFIDSYDAISTWPKELRKSLAEKVPFSSIQEITQIESKDRGTVKFLFRRVKDGKIFESVLMQHNDGRNTICVSCMIGCPVGCTFCATGQMKGQGSLISREIIDQVMHIGRYLCKKEQSITNVVFMGMGEPLLNIENVLQAIEVLTDPSKIGLGSRRITISTSGITPIIRQLISKGFKGHLTLSLHAPIQELREVLMPIAKQYPLVDLLNACGEFAVTSGRRVSYEYILISGVNDTVNHARELARILGGSYLKHVNLIPYNPVPNVSYIRSSREAIRRFSEELTRNSIEHTVRVTMGDSIQAACGQLASRVS